MILDGCSELAVLATLILLTVGILFSMRIHLPKDNVCLW